MSIEILALGVVSIVAIASLLMLNTSRTKLANAVEAKAQLESNLETEVAALSKFLANTGSAAPSLQLLTPIANQVMPLMQDCSDSSAESQRILGKLASGDFSELASANANPAVAETINSINAVLHAMEKGDYRQRANTSLQGPLAEMCESLNATCANLEDVFGKAVHAAQGLTSGDLTVRIEGQYHGLNMALIESLNNALANFGSMLAELTYNTDHIIQQVSSVARGSNDLSNRTQEQAASLEETASAMESLTDMVTANANSAESASTFSQQAKQTASSSAKVVGKTIEAMDAIQISSNKISDIISLIDGIAFQTNLLALNASVEAARAGEHGRGFAVVAGEVRTLAQRSADAAKEITVLIENSVHQVRQGTNLANESGEAIKEIDRAVNEMSDLIGDLVESSASQRSSIGEINQAVTILDSATQQNAALIEESASSTMMIDGSGKEVQAIIGNFNTNIDQLQLGNSMRLGNFIFARARRAHLDWVGRMRAFINGVETGIDERTARDPSVCMLGKWMASEEAAPYRHTQVFVELDKHHKHLHGLIGGAIDEVNCGCIDNAENLVDEMIETSAKVIGDLNSIEVQALQRG